MAWSQSVSFRLNDRHHHQGCGVGVKTLPGVWVLAWSQSVSFRLNDRHHHQGCEVGVRVSPESGFWPGVKMSLLDLMTAIIIRNVELESESPRSLGDGLESKCLF